MPSLLSFLKSLHDQLCDHLRNVKFDKNPQEDGYLVCLYISMIELCGGIVVLVGKERKTPLSPVFRTFLEAYVDFKNVAACRAYVKYAYAHYNKDWIRILSAKPNPFLETILADKDRPAALERHKTKLKKLKEQKIEPLTVKDRFAKAGMANEYLSIYHFESNGAHNNLQALLGRHFEEVQSDFRLTFYKSHSSAAYDIYLDTTAECLLDASRTVHEQLASDKQAAIEDLRLQLVAIRKRAAGE